MNISEFRTKYPEYSDVNDNDLSQKLHAKYYSDMPIDQFKQKFLGEQKHEAETDKVGWWDRTKRSVYNAVVNHVNELDPTREVRAASKLQDAAPTNEPIPQAPILPGAFGPMGASQQLLAEQGRQQLEKQIAPQRTAQIEEARRQADIIPTRDVPEAKPLSTFRGWADLASDVGVGAGEFVGDVALFKKFTGVKSDLAAFEFANRIAGGKPGDGAVMAFALGRIGSIPTTTKLEKAGKIGLESVAMGGLAASQGSDLKGILTQAALPGALHILKMCPTYKKVTNEGRAMTHEEVRALADEYTKNQAEDKARRDSMNAPPVTPTPENPKPVNPPKPYRSRVDWIRDQIQDLLDHYQTPEGVKEGEKIADRLEYLNEKFDALAGLEGLSLTELHDYAKREKMDIPKGTTKTGIIRLLRGEDLELADLQKTAKANNLRVEADTDGGYKVYSPVQKTTAGDTWETKHFDEAHAADEFMRKRTEAISEIRAHLARIKGEADAARLKAENDNREVTKGATDGKEVEQAVQGDKESQDETQGQKGDVLAEIPPPEAGAGRETAPASDEIWSPAIEDEGSKLYVGPNHDTINAENPKIKGGKKGFVTKSGKFVGRKEAAKIAQKAGQLTSTAKAKPPELLRSHHLDADKLNAEAAALWAAGKKDWKKFYSAIWNRMQEIEDVVKRAQAAGANIQPGTDAGMRARGYLGIGGKVSEWLYNSSFDVTPDGKIKRTGESLFSIYDDFDKLFKDKPVEERASDLDEYQIARRTIEDLQRPRNEWSPEQIVTEEQVAESRQKLAELARKYGDDGIAEFEKSRKRLIGYRRRLLLALVKGGNMSLDQYNDIIAKNPNYVPFDRVMEEFDPETKQMKEKEQKGGTPRTKERFSGAKSPVKKIKGSRREIQNVTESDIKNTYRILDAAERNTVARYIARLSDVLPDEISPVKIPIVPIAVVQHWALIDPILTGRLKDIIRTIGTRYERPMHIKEKRSAAGVYIPGQDLIKAKFATPEGVIAHELGHALDTKYGLSRQLLSDAVRRKELNDVAAMRYEGVTPSGDFRAYAHTPEEQMAAMFDAYLTKQRIMDEIAPNTKKFLDEFLASKPELKPLVDIQPSLRIQSERINETIFRPSKFKPKGNIIEYFEGGKRSYMKVTPELYQAMTGMNEVAASWLIKFMSVPSRMLRFGATHTPEFMVGNPIKDNFDAYIQTKVGFIPFIDTARAMADIVGKSDMYHDWLASGAAHSGFVEISRNSLRKAGKELRSEGGKKLLKYLNPFVSAGAISELGEKATRVAVFKSAVQRGGMSPIEAMMQSREATLDFSRIGSKTRELNMVDAFFNAGMQALDKFVRVHKERPVSTAVKAIATITIPTMMLYLRNRKDPKYQDVPRWERDIFWVTKSPVGDFYLRFPKPFLFGSVYGTVMERFMEYCDSKDPTAFDGLYKTMAEAALPSAEAVGYLPNAIRPLVENYTNWNFFRNAPLVSDTKKQLLPEYQYTKYTSETSKIFGKMYDYSPAKIDNLIQGWTGGTGKYMMEGSDYLVNSIRRARGAPVPQGSPKEPSDYPLAKEFAARSPEAAGSQSLTDFYDLAQDIQASKQTVDMLNRQGKHEEAKRVRVKHPLIVLEPAVVDARKTLSDINKSIERITSANIGPEEKKARLTKLQDRKMDIAKRMISRIRKEEKKHENDPYRP